MARHLKSHADIPGVEYDPVERTLYIDIQTIADSNGRNVDGNIGMPVAVQVYRDWCRRMPECRPYRVAIKGLR